jgi:hypothetical protein
MKNGQARPKMSVPGFLDHLACSRVYFPDGRSRAEGPIYALIQTAAVLVELGNRSIWV